MSTDICPQIFGNWKCVHAEYDESELVISEDISINFVHSNIRASHSGRIEEQFKLFVEDYSTLVVITTEFETIQFKLIGKDALLVIFGYDVPIYNIYKRT
eukprot:TRINITY_DN12365_c0_g1_i1.p1 TRINITY_DN12365_c0_g1~~TRINITY_DN12365_c0_g1_i1.p1  ORF type:complete len:100 (-),score=14.67 TRINITY_DN12365_c0_g1_i1:31-330(-)